MSPYRFQSHFWILYVHSQNEQTLKSPQPKFFLAVATLEAPQPNFILAVAALKAPQPKVLQLKQVLTLIRTFLLKIPNHHNRHNQNLKISEIVKLFFGIMYPTTNRVFGPEESIGIIF